MMTQKLSEAKPMGRVRGSQQHGTGEENEACAGVRGRSQPDHFHPTEIKQNLPIRRNTIIKV